jgi:hypothetical protein
VLVATSSTGSTEARQQTAIGARQQEGEDNLLQEVKQGEGEREELWKEDLANGLAFECVSYFDMYR